jgi:hypothetical protein
MLTKLALLHLVEHCEHYTNRGGVFAVDDLLEKLGIEFRLPLEEGQKLVLGRPMAL